MTLTEGVVRLQPSLAADLAQRTMLPQVQIDQTVAWLRDSLI
jgi:hypothetical protein